MSNALLVLKYLPGRDVDLDPGPYTQTVTLPSTPCENCTLQVIQMMYDKPPYGPAGGADIYFQCVDIALRVGGAPAGPDAGPGTTPEPSPDGTATGGCSAATAPGILLGLALFTLRPRRNRPRSQPPQA